MRQKLRKRFEESIPAIRTAGADPLTPADKLYLSIGGKQFLPRLPRPTSSPRTPVLDLAAELYRYRSEPTAPEPWQQRMELLRAIEASVARREPERANQLLEQLLRHRAEHPLPPAQEIPFTLLVAEQLNLGKATPPLVHGLVRGGLPEELGGMAQGAGLQRDLLRECHRFTRPDFDFLYQRVLDLSAALGAPFQAFRARVRELGPGVIVLPVQFSEPTLYGQRWYMEQHGESVWGIAVEPEKLLATITQEMRQRQLLGKDDHVRLGAIGAVQPLSSLKIEAVIPRWDAEEEAIMRRYGLKTLLVAICGALAVAIVALAGLAQHRKYRFLELKSDFVATVSHELRTPLASIRLLAETLEMRAGGSPEVRDYPARIIQAADGLHFLVENILSFNRIDKGRWSPQLALVRLEELIGHLRADLSGACRVPVELTADVGDVELWADPSLLRLLLSNLGRNACNYNRRNPVQLSIRVHVTPGNGFTLLFGDNGIGIPESEWENVFQDFYRLTPTGQEVHGSGLGLALCRRIMHVHGGQIRVAASSPQGTTFALIFPETLR
jgi:signal transduction histidine kinase